MKTNFTYVRVYFRDGDVITGYINRTERESRVLDKLNKEDTFIALTDSIPGNNVAAKIINKSEIKYIEEI